MPVKALFANRAPGFSEELKKDEQLKRISQSSYGQNQKKPRFDDYRRDSGRRIQG